MSAPPIHDEEALIDRIEDEVQRHPQRVVFLVGSALTMPAGPEEPGVPGVAGVVELIARELGDRAGDRLQQALARERNRYQAAFRFLSGRRDPDTANRIIRQAVLAARRQTPGPKLQEQLMGADPAVASARCRELEIDIAGWALPPGAASLGRLLVEGEHLLGEQVLTTNFDPLIEVAISAAGGQWRATRLPGDGSFEQSHGLGCHVVHLHGYWHGVDTLHTPSQLAVPRPTLQAGLQRLLRQRTVVVVGYGGWEDAFTSALRDLVGVDPMARPSVLWTFYEDDEQQIEERYRHVFSWVRSARDRVVFYRGIDVRTFFESLRIRLCPSPRPSASRGPSPFVVGRPIARDEDLFGRQRERDELGAALYGGHSVQILGERRMGKTSLLWWTQRHAPASRPVVCVDAMSSAGWSPADFVRALARQLGREAEVEGLLGEVPRGPHRALEALGPMLLMVDEADVLVEPRRGFDADFFNLLRALGQTGQVPWVSASRRDLRELLVESALTSPFLNDALTVWAGAMEPDAVRAMVGRGRALDPAVDPAVVLEQTGAAPYAVQWWCDARWKATAASDLGEALGRVMAQVFASWWRGLVAPERSLMLQCQRSAVTVAALDDRSRRRALRLLDRGLLQDHEERLRVRGAAWRRFIDEHHDPRP
ncbi:MAG: AAA family ATPase [Myxococcota bacterium]